MTRRGIIEARLNAADGDLSQASWLAEIAYQLAVMNEREAERERETQDATDKRVAAILRKVGIPDL